ncbi:hypothetical protein [Campylobacter sputorum]|uniref:hypothetical protein n=1 Tax=Campylobacter sputorum TaxID=206 RepID=UPI000B77E26F|nr:hypothetical protein [Campylobacter sputorum]ASM37151.1 hypothetical protein CSF_1295 [Campylobacter sputorum bv. faecalis CCUG 20703]
MSIILIQFKNNLKNIKNFSENLKPWHNRFSFSNLLKLPYEFERIASINQNAPKSSDITMNLMVKNIISYSNIVSLFFYKNATFFIENNGDIYKISGNIFEILKSNYFLENKSFIEDDEMLFSYSSGFFGVFSEFIRNKDILSFLKDNFENKISSEFNEKIYINELKEAYDTALSNLNNENINEILNEFYKKLKIIIKKLDINKFKPYKFIYMNKNSKRKINFDNKFDAEIYLQYAYKTTLATINLKKNSIKEICLKDKFLNLIKNTIKNEVKKKD